MMVTYEIKSKYRLTEDDIHNAFNKTTVSTRVSSLDSGLQGEKGEELNTLYETIEQLREPWGVSVICSDGGVKEFYVTYKLSEEFLVNIKRINFYTKPHINSTIDLVDWLMTKQTELKTHIDVWDQKLKGSICNETVH